MKGPTKVTGGRDTETREVSATVIQGLQVFPANAVDLRRDLHLFLEYVKAKGLLRTKRRNRIPKVAARRLAKILSWAGEAEAVAESGSGCWSDHLSHIARHLGIASFDMKGVYEGYTSTEPSYPDNEIEIQEPAWGRYLRKSPLEKERALLDVLVENTPNEFFREATLVPGAKFDMGGCGTGPAGRMDLPKIRRQVLNLLATLEPGIWYTFEDVVGLLGSRHPDLILDRATREPGSAFLRELRDWERERRAQQMKGARGTGRTNTKKPEVVLEDLYVNFRETDPAKAAWDASGHHQFTMETPRVFHRVEGRYLDFFLREIPYALGFVDLGYRPDSDPHGLDVTPPLERLTAIRMTNRFRSFMNASGDFGRVKVTILPTLEILVESDSYPETTLRELAPFTRHLREDGPIHKLKLDRMSVTRAVAENEKARPVRLLEKLSDRPVPQNVRFDLDTWASRGDRLVLYEGLGLLEMQGNEKEKKAARKAAGDLLVDTPLEGFALVRKSERVFERLEKSHLVPVRVGHLERRYASCAGRLASPPNEASRAGRKQKSATPPPAAAKARMAKEDLVGYRSASPPLLVALFDSLSPEPGTCILAGDDLLVVSASLLPALRKALHQLAGRFEVTIEDAP